MDISKKPYKNNKNTKIDIINSDLIRKMQSALDYVQVLFYH